MNDTSPPPRENHMKKHVQRLDVKKGTLQSICEGRKPLLVRVDDRTFTRFSVGDKVKVCSGDRACTCKILAIRRYASLEELLSSEDLTKIAHGSHEEARVYLENIYPEIPTTHRFVVLELNLLRIGRQPVSRG